VCCGHGEYPPIIKLKKMPTAYFQLSDLFFDWGTITTEEAIKRIRENDIDIRSNITQQDEILFRLLNNMDVIEATIEEGRITIQLEYR
jgi:hypothetical protein